MDPRTQLISRLRSARSWSKLPQVLEELERGLAELDKEARTAGLVELGLQCEELLLQSDRALGYYRAALALDARNKRAREGIERIGWELGDLGLVAEMLGQALSAARSQKAKAALQGRLGCLQLDLGQLDEARTNLEVAREAKLEAVDAKPCQEALAALDHDRKEWLDEAEALIKQAEGAEPGAAAQLYLRVARIYRIEMPGDPAIIDVLQRAMASDPDLEEAALLLERVLVAAEAWDDLMGVHEGRARFLADPTARLALLRRMGTRWAVQFKDPERAVFFYRKALEQHYLPRKQGEADGFAGHLAAFRQVCEVLGAHGEWGELLQLVDLGLQGQRKGDERVVLAGAAGEIAWQAMKDRERAQRYFSVVRELDPHSEELRDFMGHVGEIVQEVADTSDTAKVAMAAGGVVEAAPAPNEELPPDAVATARAAEASSVDKGIEAWRKLAAAHPTAHAPRIELGRIYRKAERWSALAELLREQAEKHSVGDEKIATYFDLAELYKEKLRNDGLVVTALNTVLGLAPHHPRALDALLGQYEHMKRWPDLAGVLQKKAAAATSDGEKIELYGRLAQLYQERFSNVAEAIKAYEKVLEIDPRHSAAIAFLKANYEKRRDWEKLIAVELREIAELPAAEQPARFVAVAKVASEKLKKPLVCIDLWEKVLAAEPGHGEALGELEKLYEREKQWDRLAAVCQQQAEATTDPARRSAALQKLGLLFTEKVVDGDRALAAWRALLAIEPENRRAQEALKKVYLQQRNFAELEAFFAAQNKLDEYARVLERQAESEDDPTKIQLHLRIAELYRDRLGKADRALRAYERVLTLDAQHLGAAEALIPLYEATREPRKLAAVLEVQLHATQEAGVRRQRMQHLAELCEGMLRDKAAAYGWCLRGFAEENDSTWARSGVERLAKETGGFAELVAAYEKAAEALLAARSPALALSLLAMVAQVYETELGDTDRTLAVNRQILALDEHHAGALAALERLYIATQRFSELLEIYERKLAVETDPAVQRDLRYRMAHLFEEELRDRKRAAEVYRTILAEGDVLPALRSLDRLMVAEGQWKEIGNLIERQLLLVDTDDARAQLKFRFAELHEQHLDDVEGAIACYRELLELAPEHAGARAALERRLSDRTHQLAAAELLEPIYQRSESWRELIDLHEVQLVRETEGVRRGELLAAIGELWAHRLGDGDKAFEAYSRCFQEQPASPVRGELERLAAHLDEWKRLVRLYEGVLEKNSLERGDPGLLRELLHKVAEVYSEKLGDAPKAVEVYRRALSADPDDLGALEALERLYTKQEKWPELLEVYRRQIELLPLAREAAREALYFRVAYLWDEVLQNPDEAIAAYREILGFSGGQAKALTALDRLYQGKRAWHELADNLGQQLSLTAEQGDRAELLARLAALRERQLGEVAAAIDTYRQVLELAPDHEVSRTALDRLIKVPEHELQVAQILEPIYRTGGESTQLVEVYEVMARHTFDPARKIELFEQIGELHELGGDDPGKAFSAYDRSLREDPARLATHDRLQRLSRAIGRFGELVQLYREIAEKTTDTELRAEMWQRVAQLSASELNDIHGAAEAYGQVLEADPKNLDAADALEAIYLSAADFTHLVEVVLRKVEMVEELTTKKELCFKAAKLFEEVLESGPRAIEAYRLVLSLDESDVQALDALERLCIQHERWSDLKEIYAKKAAMASSVDDKKQMYFVLGQVYDRELRDPARAIETYQAVLDLDPDDFQAIEALDRLYGESSRWYDLLQILEREVELAPSPPETASLKFRIGQLWEKELRDVGRAVAAYRDVLAIDVAHGPTLAALEALLHGEVEPVAAAQVLEPVFASAGDWERLIDVLEVVAKHADDPQRRVDLLHQIGDLYERNLERLPEAFTAYARALHQNPQDEPTLAHLERLAGETRAWRELVVHYEEELKKLLDPAQQLELLVRAGRVYEEELGDVEAAIHTYRRVLELDEEQGTAIAALDRLYQVAQHWSELTEILRRKARLALGDEERVTVQFRLAQVYEQLQQENQALEVYREILATDPSHGATLSALELWFAEGKKRLEVAALLEPLYRAAEQWEKLVTIHEAQLGAIPAADERFAQLQRMAEICELRLVDLGAALSYWARALGEVPTSGFAMEELERLAGLAGAWDPLVGIYSDRLAHEKDPAVQRPLLLRLARVHEVERRDVASAETIYLRVLELDPKDSDALAALDRIYSASSMWNELATVLERRVALTTVSDELVELHTRLGRLHAEALDDADRAVAAYLAVLHTDSRNQAALEALEAIYFQREQWPELFGVYEKMVDLADGDEAMADCYARMARIASHALEAEQKVAERAIDLWRRVIDLRGDAALALASLTELYRRAELWRELTEVLERQIQISDGADQVLLYSELGQVWQERLGQEEPALEAWQHVLDLDAQNLPALRAVAAIQRHRQAWDDLAETLRRMIDLGAGLTDGELERLYADLGRLQGETLLRPLEAIEAWQEVLRLAPQNLEALDALERLYSQEAHWEPCVGILEHKAQLLEEGAQRIDVLLRAATLWQEMLGDAQRAGAAYERVLQIDASHSKASVELEQIYRATAEWEKLIELLLQRVEHVDDSSRRITLFHSVSQVYERELGDGEGAFVVLQAAFKEDFSDSATASELERLATVLGRWNELIGDYTQAVEGIADPKAAASLWVKIGRWYGEHLHQFEYAITSEQKALTLDPESRDALAALGDLYRKASRWVDLVAVLERHVALASEPSDRLELYLTVADLYESQLSDPVRAIAAYRQAVATEPDCLDALNALERLHTAQREWNPLVEVLARKAQATPEADAVVRLKQQIGRIYEEELYDDAQAIEAYRDVLVTDPLDRPALTALERLYAKTGSTEGYLAVLERELDVVASDLERISVYERIAAAQQREGRLEKTWEALEKILLIDDRHEATFNLLEDLYWKGQRFAELVDTYRRHLAATENGAQRMELLRRIGEVYENQLGTPDRAIDAYLEIAAELPQDFATLTALSRLYEKIGDWDRALEIMERLVQLTDDPRVRVEQQHRIGRAQEIHLRDSDAAEARYVEALAIDPTFVPAMASLTGLYQRRGDWLKAAQMMVRAESNTPNPLEKVKLLFEAARIYRDKLADEARAGELCARVLMIDPEHVEAGEPLADLYFREAMLGLPRWAELEPVLDMLVRKAELRPTRAPAAELHPLYFRLAKTAEEQGHNDKALKNYQLAHEFDATHLPTLLGRAGLLYRLEDWDGAFKIYQTILLQHRDAQKGAETVEIFFRLGQIKRWQNDRAKAQNMFEKALEIDPAHRPTLLALMELQQSEGNFEALIVAKRALLPVADEEERRKLYEEIGDLYQEKVHNPAAAIAAYEEALTLGRNNHVVLHKLLELFHATAQWKRMVEILLQITEIEKDPLRRGKYYSTAGVVFRDELQSPDESIDYFNLALDSFFEKPEGITPASFSNYLKSFEAIDKICTTKRDWKQQERNYRKMLKRIPAEGYEQIKIALWHGLGEIYRSRLRDQGGAIQAFEVASKLDPANVQRHEILAELYTLAGPDELTKAAAEHMFLIKQDPLRIASYQALRKLYMDMRQYDRAWCLCSALAYMQRASAEEQSFFDQYKPKTLLRAKQRISDEVWFSSLFHPEEDRYLGAIFGAVWQAVALLKSGEHKQFNLKRKDRLDLVTHQALFSKVFAYVAQTLNVMVPEIYLRPEQMGGLQIANCKDKGQLVPSLVVGAELLQGRSDRDLAFPLARFLTLLRSEHYLKLTLPTNTELRIAFFSAIKLVQPSFPVPPAEEPTVNQYMQAMRTMVQPAWLEQLALVVQRFLSTQAQVDLARWTQAVDLTAHRVGLVLCGDLALAAGYVQMEPTIVGGMQPKDKVKELLAYAISEPYFELRQQLGLAIG